MAEYVLDPAEWPRWFHHVSRVSILCDTPEDAEDLPEGYRKQPFSEDEKYQHGRAKQAEAEVVRKSKARDLAADLEEPVDTADDDEDLEQEPLTALEAILARPVDADEAEALAPPPAPPRIQYKRPSRAKPQPRVRTPIRYGQPRKP